MVTLQFVPSSVTVKPLGGPVSRRQIGTLLHVQPVEGEGHDTMTLLPERVTVSSGPSNPLRPDISADNRDFVSHPKSNDRHTIFPGV